VSAAAVEPLSHLVDRHSIHTIEVGTPDTQGHIRGKRVPSARFLQRIAVSGLNIADAMFVFDMQNDLPDNEYVNMESGFLDCRLVPDLASARLLTHRPGYVLVFADAIDSTGQPHPLAPRGVLAAQVARCRALGLDPVVATELEFYLCTPDWQPIQHHIQYSSLTDSIHIETILLAMRNALAGAGLEVESSNFEYGPGQVEINIGPADALTTADNTVLFKSIVKQVAAQHGLRATFMAKPWAEHSGSGMHIHTSLAGPGGKNVFAECAHAPSGVMAAWLAGQVEHAAALTVLGVPTPNGTKRMRPYTFAPTHVHWGLDNRTVLARCIVEPGSAGNRVEFRSAGADANPYAIIAGLLAAGADGIERGLAPPPMSIGDMYTNPGDSTPIPTDTAEAVDLLLASPLAELLGIKFSRSYAGLARREALLAGEHAPDADAVSDWERDRFLAHS
jgi:glutamine synthetase